MDDDALSKHRESTTAQAFLQPNEGRVLVLQPLMSAFFFLLRPANLFDVKSLS
jgi:hypothetical protein